MEKFDFFKHIKAPSFLNGVDQEAINDAVNLFKRKTYLNLQRLKEEPYDLTNLFRPTEYDWPGDWEGRALLAFMCHYEINCETSPHLFDFVSMIPEKTNEHFYFGKKFDGETADEQQLSGHNWYLRGLIKYNEHFPCDNVREYAKSVVENLYLPLKEWYLRYPLDNRANVGDVSGSVTDTVNGWRLSSDVGCAFMCVDGLVQYLKLSHDARVYELLDTIIDVFAGIDLLKYKMQTHTTLTCLRGIFALYQMTKKMKYLKIVIDKFTFYVENGMTLTYENFNWFGRNDTWTEPCAVVDSFILATKLYNLTSDEKYKTLARRIWFNGLSFCQRENGGAGPNTCVRADQPILKISMYEAPFCCTMRYAEGLLECSRNFHLFIHNKNAAVETDSYGRRFVDDVLLVKLNGEEMPIFSCITLPKEEAEKIKLSVF